jgi:site-specific DNA-methyltransferase (adenine-specific)
MSDKKPEDAMTTPIDLRLGRWQDVLAGVECDALICDPPYSARTHEGSTDEVLNATGKKATLKSGRSMSDSTRRPLNYTSWTPADVSAFVSSWAPRTKGWMVCVTSHDLVSAYEQALAEQKRLTFAPLPWFSPGSRVRLTGDGPSSWTCWIVVSRPRRAPYAKWGTLPGGYVFPPEKCPVVGGKPLGLMQAIVRDYSRPGDLVVDPFCGSGTTALACAMEGRRCVTSEELPDHYEIAKKRLGRHYQPALFT